MLFCQLPYLSVIAVFQYVSLKTKVSHIYRSTSHNIISCTPTMFIQISSQCFNSIHDSSLKKMLCESKQMCLVDEFRQMLIHLALLLLLDTTSII